MNTSSNLDDGEECMTPGGSKTRRTNYRMPENKAKLDAAVQEIIVEFPTRCPGLKPKCLSLAAKYQIPANTIRDNYLRLTGSLHVRKKKDPNAPPTPRAPTPQPVGPNAAAAGSSVPPTKAPAAPASALAPTQASVSALTSAQAPVRAPAATAAAASTSATSSAPAGLAAAPAAKAAAVPVKAAAVPKAAAPAKVSSKAKKAAPKGPATEPTAADVAEVVPAGCMLQ